MKGNALLVLLFLAIGFMPKIANAQSTTIDIVTLKDGQVLKGKIIRYTPGQTLLLQKDASIQVELSDADIAKIQQGVELDAEATDQQSQRKLNELPTARTQGLYANSIISFAAGNSEVEGLSLGAGFNQVFGYQISSFLGLGFGFGVDNYSHRGETVYPLFGEVRGFFPSTKATGNYYAMVGGGYSLAFPRERLDIQSADGGPMGQFAIGYRAATTEGVDIYFDMGAKFQKAHFMRTLFNGDVEDRKIDFRRVMIRIGIGLWK